MRLPWGQARLAWSARGCPGNLPGCWRPNPSLLAPCRRRHACASPPHHRQQLGRLRGVQTLASAAAEPAAAAPQEEAEARPAKPQGKQQQPKQQQKQQQGGGGGGGKKGGGERDTDRRVVPKSEDFSQWYLSVVREAELADYGPVRGTMVIRPYGYALWEALQAYLDGRFKALGVQNAYFPALIPLSFLRREADHVEGFAPELALVTQGGGKELEEPLVLRPTSETVVNHCLAAWVQSHRDLPLRLNQWANVHRWELRPRPFIRTVEFLWQEGHTAHATAEEAEETARTMIQVYADFATKMAAIPIVIGRKSRAETFAGANITYTIEAMMGDKRALQAGTSHNLGDNFARAFGTTFLDANGKEVRPQQTSWGMSTRMIGGLIMTHGDDVGLRLPPAMAPIQVVFVPIARKAADRPVVAEAVERLAAAAGAAGVRCRVDDAPDRTPGWKFNHWEMKGVPLRVELGPRDISEGQCVVARRDRPGKEAKLRVPIEPEAFVKEVRQLLDAVQAGLLEEATAFRDAHTADVANYEELQAAVAEGKWARGWWAGSDEDERAVKEATTATLRCIPLDQPPGAPGTCFYTGQPAESVAIFARAY